MTPARRLTGSFAGLAAVDARGRPIEPPRAARAFGAGDKFHRRQPPVLGATSFAQVLAKVDDAHAGLSRGLGARSAEHDADKVWLRLLALATLRSRATGYLGRDLAWFDGPRPELGGSTPFEAARDLPRYFALLGRLVLNGGQETSDEDDELLAEQPGLGLGGSHRELASRALAALAPRFHYSPYLVSIYFGLLRLPSEGGATLLRLAKRSDEDAVARALLEHFDIVLPADDEISEDSVSTGQEKAIDPYTNEGLGA